MVTVIIAAIGMNTWKRETAGRASFETARELIRSAYRLREAIKRYRAPFKSAAEFPDGYNPTKATAKEEADAFAFVYQNRLKPVSDAIEELDTHALEAEALWGDKPHELVEDLWKVVRSLLFHTQRTLDLIEQGKRGSQKATEHQNAISAPITDTETPLSKQMYAAISALEEYLKPILHRDR